MRQFSIFLYQDLKVDQKFTKDVGLNFQTSKEKNIHLIRAISLYGFINYEILRGSFDNQSDNDYIRRLFRLAKNEF